MTPVHQLMYCKVKSCMLESNKSIIQTILIPMSFLARIPNNSYSEKSPSSVVLSRDDIFNVESNIMNRGLVFYWNQWFEVKNVLLHKKQTAERCNATFLQIYSNEETNYIWSTFSKHFHFWINYSFNTWVIKKLLTMHLLLLYSLYCRSMLWV